METIQCIINQNIKKGNRIIHQLNGILTFYIRQLFRKASRYKGQGNTPTKKFISLNL